MSEIKSKSVTDQTFQSDVLDASGVALVDLWAEWCGPCKIIGPTIDALAGEYAGKVGVYKLNVDENTAIPAQFHVRGIPTLLIFKEGKLVDQLVGAHPKATIVAALDKQLA